jgi:uncharacterized protein YaiE (UPF0345 family)
MIAHNSYFNDQVQSLGFTQADGTKATVGVILPGEYTFNTATEERMTVVSGVCTMNGQTVKAGETFTVAANSKLVLEAKAAVAYLCTYHS